MHVTERHSKNEKEIYLGDLIDDSARVAVSIISLKIPEQLRADGLGLY